MENNKLTALVLALVAAAGGAGLLVKCHVEPVENISDAGPTDAGTVVTPDATPPPPPSCGDTMCNGEETCSTCVPDCGQCPPTCSDKVCNGQETCSSCPFDCGVCAPVCGDNSCNGAETCTVCALDCGACPPVCGDKTCNGQETCSLCPGDCGSCPPVCGDRTCNGQETCSTCASDCGGCPTDGFTFSAVGDIGNNSDATAVLKTVPGNGEFFLMLGDLSYQAPPETVWCSYVKNIIGTLPVVIVSGNHESVSTYNNGLIDNFIAANCLPPPSFGFSGVYGKEFFFDYPKTAPIARFIAVSPDLPFQNPTTTYSSKVGTAHYKWASDTIDQARAAGIKWIIIATHRPCLSVGVKTCEMGTDFFNLLIQKKVDLVLMGHDHGYQRSKQLAHSTNCTAITPNVLNTNCIVDDGKDDLYTRGSGPVFVVAGMGGRAAYAGSATDPEVQYMSNFMAVVAHGITKVKVTKDRLDLDFVKANGATFADHFSIVAPIIGPPAPAAEPAMTNVPVTELTSNLVNPERGMYVGLNLIEKASSAATYYAAGHTLAIALIRLDAYQNATIDQAFLDRLTSGFATVRTSGMKVILRFEYNSSSGGADAPLSRVLEHIVQLAPILIANSDVIAVQQAGFIGAWGEWHSSTNGLTTVANETAILNAILSVLPTSRAVQIRTPMAKAAIYPGLALQSREETNKGRVGHHNDCFLASDSDFGTYSSPVSTWKSYVAQDGLFTPVGGETCAVYSPRSDCPSAVQEMSANHWSYLNSQYNRLVLDKWVTDGCYDTVKRLLGYYLAVSRVIMSEEVRPGGVLQVEFDIANHGYSALFNFRPVYLVFKSGTTSNSVFLPVDPRNWRSGVSTVKASIRIPATLAPGSYAVSVWMPDASLSLRNDAKYAVKLANANNVINPNLVVSTTAIGSVDLSATTFSVVQ